MHDLWFSWCTTASDSTCTALVLTMDMGICKHYEVLLRDNGVVIVRDKTTIFSARLCLPAIVFSAHARVKL